MMQRHAPQPHGIARQPAQRRGFNLAELMFVIAAISALAVLVMTVIGLLITAEQHAAETLWVDVTISSFATDLREDAHQARALEADADEKGHAPSVTFLLPDESRVTYECVQDGVIRRQTASEGPDATQTYRLALGSSTFLVPGEEGLLQFTHLRTIPSIGGMGQPSADAGAVMRTFHIATAVGLHADVDGEDNQ